MTWLTLCLAAVFAGGSPADAEEQTASRPKEVSFSTSDGGVVFADEYGEGKHAVVLAPGGRFYKESWADQAPVLAEAGLRVLSIDFRGKGQSRGGPDGSEHDLYLDVLAAVRYLRESGAEEISVVGASLGGWAAGNAAVAAKPGTIDRLVLLAHAAVKEPEKMQGRKLFLTARDDLQGSGKPRLDYIQDQYEKAPGPKELIVVEGSAHAQFLFETDQGPRVLETILEFLSAP